MKQCHWEEGVTKSLGIYLNGDAIPSLDMRGEPVKDDCFYVIFNAHSEPLSFTLPDATWGRRWGRLLDTWSGNFEEQEWDIAAQDQIEVPERSIILLIRRA
jgi:glycogen operon protein